jgi:N-acetylglucosaminyl-diphospho-decaprenol L-rhamnosyltransferase
MPSPREITVSVVSHRHNALLNDLLADFERHCAQRIAVVVTLNVGDEVPLCTAFTYPIEVINNASVRGFGANHNAAFARCRSTHFCVANPDIRLAADPFAPLTQSLSRAGAAVAGPLVRGADGAPEDSARRFPTVRKLLGKLAGGRPGLDYPLDRGPLEVDWIAGMFMLFRSEAFRAAGGFDERYFLYYEDVEICRRVQRSGGRVVHDPRAVVTHLARRASRRNARHAFWHLASMLRYFATR